MMRWTLKCVWLWNWMSRRNRSPRDSRESRDIWHRWALRTRPPHDSANQSGDGAISPGSGDLDWVGRGWRVVTGDVNGTADFGEDGARRRSRNAAAAFGAG